MTVNNHQITNVINGDSTIDRAVIATSPCRVFIIPIISPMYTDIDAMGLFIIINAATDLFEMVLVLSRWVISPEH